MVADIDRGPSCSGESLDSAFTRVPRWAPFSRRGNEAERRKEASPRVTVTVTRLLDFLLNGHSDVTQGLACAAAAFSLVPLPCAHLPSAEDRSRPWHRALRVRAGQEPSGAQLPAGLCARLGGWPPRRVAFDTALSGFSFLRLER